MVEWREGPGLAGVRVVKAIDGPCAGLVDQLGEAGVRWTPLVEQPRGDVWLADAGAAGRWIVKTERSSGWKGGLRRMLGRGPRARAYGWGRALGSSSLVASPAALIRARRRDGPRVEATITPELRGPTLLEALTHDDIELARCAADGAAEHAVDLLARNIWNRDHKPSNLVFDGAVEPGRLRLVDLDGLRRPVVDPRRAVLRMLTSLVIETKGVGRPIDSTVRWRLDSGFFQAVGPDGWELFDDEIDCVERLSNRVDEMVDAHGDPTPQRDPLEAERRRRGEPPSHADPSDTL